MMNDQRSMINDEQFRTVKLCETQCPSVVNYPQNITKEMKVLVATEKPFAKIAVDGIKKEIEGAGFELALLEKYTDKAQLLDAVKDCLLYTSPSPRD